MIYAPFLVKTLCRYELFKRCLESLSANGWARYTPVYVALDYPFKDEHWDGYNKIKEFLKGDFSFKELNIIERKTNFGPVENGKDAREQIFQKYDRIIISEDDNEFSPNFLEYIDKGLEKFENDESIYAICGFSLSASCIKEEIDFQGNTFLRNGSFFNPWGVGIWKNRYQNRFQMKREHVLEYLKKQNIFKIVFQTPKNLRNAVLTVCLKTESSIDYATSIYLVVNNKKIIEPVTSKVKNLGRGDKDGVTFNPKAKCPPTPMNQVLDSAHEFSFVEQDNNFELSKKCEILLHRTKIPPWSLGKKYILKLIFRYVLIRIFGADFVRKRYPARCSYLPEEFAKMRSEYLEQKAKKEKLNA
jgi:hypothetical protein